MPRKSGKELLETGRFGGDEATCPFGEGVLVYGLCFILDFVATTPMQCLDERS